MDRPLWIAKKNQICVLIKKLSDHYGGDDIAWLRDFCREAIESNKDDLNALLACVMQLEATLKYIPRKVNDVLRGTQDQPMATQKPEVSRCLSTFGKRTIQENTS